MLGPQRAATSGVRGDIASSAGGEQRPRREEERGEVHDRDLTRTAHHRTREAVRREPATSRALRDDRRSWRFRRQAKLHLEGSFGKRIGRLPTYRRGVSAQGESAREARCVERRTAARECTGNRAIRWCSGRESVAEVGETHLSRGVTRVLVLATARGSTGGREIARGDHASLWRGRRPPERGPPERLRSWNGGKARGERQGAGRNHAREQQARSSPPRPQGSGQSDGRRSGPSGGRRPKPTAATADLARWKASYRGIPERGRRDTNQPLEPLRVLEKPREGARAIEPIARQRAPEIRSYGRASPADRRRRSAAAGGSQTRVPEPRRYAAGESYHG